MYWLPSERGPNARRNAEIACSRLLSVTATSPHPAVTSASLVASSPGWLTRQ